MITDSNIKEILTMPSAKKGIKIIMTGLNVERNEAANLLYVDWIEHRAKKVPHNRLVAYAKKHLKELEYSARSVRQSYFKKWKDEREKEDRATALANGWLVVGMSEEEKHELIEKALPKLRDIFINLNTRTFVESVLKNGKEEAKKRFKLTDKQFGRKIRDIELLCAKNRLDIQKLFAKDKDAKELVILNQFIELIESENDNYDALIGECIRSNADYFDNLIGNISGIYSPILLAENWEVARLNDKYKLVNHVYKKLTTKKE
ncbi:hypothetical protein QS460_04370 [Liquorilactobacillus mali]|uniref:hypothetical protein n=1 Tax=Liquorilactobacillus mali TaxID=1618 RepID=UPI00264D8F5A|nr:hypothetical protein [Liquorilactobacillus mali]MDN7145160.1 hypothetical protein [Liquorilactobacillus mali]